MPPAPFHYSALLKPYVVFNVASGTEGTGGDMPVTLVPDEAGAFVPHISPALKNKASGACPMGSRGHDAAFCLSPQGTEGGPAAMRLRHWWRWRCIMR